MRVCPGPLSSAPNFLDKPTKKNMLQVWDLKSAALKKKKERKCCPVGPEPTAAARDSDLQTARLQPEADGRRGGCLLETRICTGGGAGLGRGLRMPLAGASRPSRTNLSVAVFSPVFSLFVSIGVKATGQGAFSDLPQKSDHPLSSPYSASLSGTWRPTGDPLCMFCCPECLPACVGG